MHKTFRLLTALLFTTSLLVACGGGSSPGSLSGPSNVPSLPRLPAQGSVSPKTVVLVYIIGADLEGIENQASTNIDEMMRVGSTPNMKVILQTGGAKKPLVGTPVKVKNTSTSMIDWKRIQRYQVLSSDLELLSDLGPDAKGTPLDMGSKATLQSFLTWGVQTYPADKYIVVLWDHGGGINKGIGADQITESVITVPEIQEALQAASQANKNIKFEMVGFDACLMANAEVAASLAASAKYMVASQDLEPGGGWAWDRFLKYVKDYPAATGKEIGVAIADSYLYKMDLIYETVTLSVTDLSKMDALSKATDGFATALQKYTTKTPENIKAWKEIAFARAQSLGWQTAPLLGQDYDLVDMVSFPSKVVTNINLGMGPDQPLMDASDALYAAVSAAVVYKAQNGSNLGASGLSLYFPSTLLTYDNADHKYASSTMSGNTPTFSSKYTDGTTGLVKTYYDFYIDNQAKLAAEVTMDSDNGKYPYGAVISNDFAMVLAAHQTDTCKIDRSADPTTPDMVESPCFDAMQLNENFTLRSDGQWGVNFTGTQSWVLIGESAYPVAMIPDRVASISGKNHSRSLVPTYYYNSTPIATGWVSAVLLVEEYVEEKDGSTTPLKVLGFQAGTPGVIGKAQRVYPIQDKDRFALGAYYLDGNTLRYTFGRTNREVTVSGGALNLKRGSIPSGGKFGYIVTDLTGNRSLVSTDVNYQN